MKKKTESTSLDDVVDEKAESELRSDRLGLARESGITQDAPAPSMTRRVKWNGLGSIAIGGIGNLEPGSIVTVTDSMARDLVRAPGFTMED